jgi:hypothetical protein
MARYEYPNLTPRARTRATAFLKADGWPVSWRLVPAIRGAVLTTTAPKHTADAHVNTAQRDTIRANPGRKRGRKARRNPVRAADRDRGELSESLALENLAAYLASRHGVAKFRRSHQELAEIEALQGQLKQLGKQIAKGLHTNPPLLIVGNPPMGRGARIPRGAGPDSAPLHFDGMIGARVLEIRYQHAEDGKLYKHAFDVPAQMYAVTRNGARALFIAGRRSLWNDFD